MRFNKNFFDDDVRQAIEVSLVLALIGTGLYIFAVVVSALWRM